MKIFCLSPIGHTSYRLFDSFEATFVAQGHQFVENIHEADVVFFDLHCGFAPYSESAFGIVTNNTPVVVFEAFDWWGTQSQPAPWHGLQSWRSVREKRETQSWANALFNFLANKAVKLYFLRKGQLSQRHLYPSFVRPLGIALYPDHVFPLTSKEEFMSRPYDLCFIGAPSVCRANMVASLCKYGATAFNYKFTAFRLEHDEWLRQHRMAKMFIECDGGGFGSERPQQLITVAPMLKNRNDQWLPEPWYDMADCVEVGDEFGSLRPEDMNKMYQVFNDPEKLYDIYRKGVEKMQRVYSEEARSLYVLNCMKEVGL